MRAFLLVLAAAACGPSAGGDRDGSVGGDATGPCRDGEHRCSGLDYQACVAGAWATETSCRADQVCTAQAGCTACTPGGLGCMGDAVVQCDAAGNPTSTVVMDCSPSTCAGGTCADPCSPEALSQSYLGCEYYAVDLPQWGQPLMLFGTIAASQQFAVAVANPWSEVITVTVEQNDAPPGSPAAVSEVTTAQVPASSLTVIPLPQREVNGYVQGSQQSRSALTTAAYRIRTSRPTSVYQFNPQNNPDAYSNDASLLIPVSALDESYLALGWPGMGGLVAPIIGPADNRSYLTVVGTRADTRVRVVPSTHVMAGDGVPALAPGEELTVTLGPFETLTLQGADFNTFGATDFTGTRVEADAPVAVWSGVECITIAAPGAMSECCCDHLEEQIYPRSALGAGYVVVRTRPRSSGSPEPDIFRVLSLADGTTVTTSLPGPDDLFTLNRGEMRQVVAATDFILSASSPVLVGQFLVGQDSVDSAQGDPAFILVPPAAQYRTRYIFLVPSGYGENYALLSVPVGATLTLDGGMTPSCMRAPVGTVGGVAYEALRCALSAGSHVLEASAPFGLVVEGFGPGPVSYGYTGGMDFEPVNEECVTDADCPGEFCSGGTCVPLIP